MHVSTAYVPSRIKSTDPLHEPRDLTAEQREVFRLRAREARAAKDAAAEAETRGGIPLHEVNVPQLDTNDLMPQLEKNAVTTLSLFSGGGGLDLGFDRAGFSHEGSWELLPDAAVVDLSSKLIR